MTTLFSMFTITKTYVKSQDGLIKYIAFSSGTVSFMLKECYIGSRDTKTIKHKCFSTLHSVCLLLCTNVPHRTGFFYK